MADLKVSNVSSTWAGESEAGDTLGPLPEFTSPARGPASLVKAPPNSIRNFNSFFLPSVIQKTISPVWSLTNPSNRNDTEAAAEAEETAQADDDNQAEDDVKKGCGTKFCSLMDRFPITFVIVAAAIGVAIGVGLSLWNPDDPSSKNAAILWVGLLGDLFIRALKCIVLPMVFVSITISVMDMLSLGEAGKVVGTTIGLYLFTTLCAAMFGVISSLIFSKNYELSTGNEVEPDVTADVRLGCVVNENEVVQTYLTEMTDGTVTCMDSSSITSDDIKLFRIEDVNNYFVKTNDAQGAAKLSLSESLYQGLFLQLIDSNMLGMFVNGNFLGVIVLGAGMGFALDKLSKNKPPGVTWERIITVQVLEELMEVFMFFIQWIIKCTPFAVISLIAKAIGQQSNIAEAMEQIGWLMAATVFGLCMQVIVVYLGLYIVIMVFASASSAATIPVSIDCAKSSGKVPDGVARFCIPLGATCNMDGGAIYILCANVWLAYQNGIVPTARDYILLVCCATLGSVGAAPVPSAAIVLILTSYATTFGALPDGQQPAGLAYLFAIDWLMDRLRSTCNLTGDLIVTRIVSSRVSADEAAMLGEIAEKTPEPEGVKDKNNNLD